MAAQVEVQTGEVGRTVTGGRLHLSPLTDSSNKSLIDIPSINQSHIIASEPNKPIPGPKPRLTPKPFAVDKNPTIKPILAPKPQPKPRPESTRLSGYKPELPNSPKPQPPVASGKPRPVSTNPNRPASTSFKTPNKLNSGQTTKPVAQPFKPAPPLDPGDPSKPTPVPAERHKPTALSLAYSKSLKTLPAAEWSGSTKKEDEKGQVAQSKSGPSITRAKSMGFLVQVGQEEEGPVKAQPEVPVTLRPQSRASRPRPVSAIFPDSPTKTETPVLAPRWAGRRPLSADLTSKFESIGLSLHRKSPKTNTKENTPDEIAQPQKREQERNTKGTTPQSTDGLASPTLSDQSNKKTEEPAVKETDEEKRGASIKSRISLLLDSSASPGAGATGQGSDLLSPVQAGPESEPAVGVKQLIKQLTVDTTPTQSPVLKPALKPRPLPLDLTKRFSSERSPDLVSLTEAADRHEISKDPQRRTEESTVTPSDHKTFLDLKDSQEQLKKASTPDGPEAGQAFGATPKESSTGSEVQTVRASLFENVVERHSVLMMDEGKSANTAKDSLSSPSFKKGNKEDEGTLVTATYKEPVSPSSPLRVLHAFDTVQAVEENRVVSENIPSAQWEDKAMTLRSRRSEGSKPVAEKTGPPQGPSSLAVMQDPQPRYLRVGALPKWTTTGPDHDAGAEKGMLTEPQREAQVAWDKDRDRQRASEQDEVAAAAKRLKMLQAEEQMKPRATYFALTGQMQEPVSPGDVGTSSEDMTVPSDDFSMRAAFGGSQGKFFPIRRNPSSDEVFGKTSQSQELVEELMMRSHVSTRDIRPTLDGQTKEKETIETEKKRELKKETERHMAKIKELEREKQKQLEIEKQAHLEFARMKEREMQREFERQRQKAFEKEKQEFEERQRALDKQKQIELEKQKLQELEREKQRKLEREEKQRALERQKQIELEKQKLQELEREKHRELEKERQRQLEREKRQEMERQKEIEREKQQEKERQRELEKERQRQLEREKRQEMERQKEIEREQQERERQREKERQRQKEEERQRELEKERQLLEIQKERERQQLLEFQKQKQKEKERQQLMELEKQRLREKMQREEAEKIRQLAIEQEMLRIRELDKERERQREMEREHQKEIEREKQKEQEKQRQRDLDRERQRQLDFEKQELEKQKMRQRELEKEKRRKEELERFQEMERRQLLEFEKQKQAERQQILEVEKRRLREKMEREEAEQREEAEKMRQIAKQQEAERQRLRQKKEEQERMRSESSPLRPKVVDLDSVRRNDPLSQATSQRSDPATRWKEPYKPAILDIDSFTSQAQLSPSKDLFPVSGIQGVDAESGARILPTPERDISWKVPSQTSAGFSSPVWTSSSPQDPWELRPVEMSVDKPVAEPRKPAHKLSPEHLLLRQEERLQIPQRPWSAVLDESQHFALFPGVEGKTGNSAAGGHSSSSSTPAELDWLPKELQPQDSKGEVHRHRRSQGSQELNRMRSRSVSRRSAPSGGAVEGSLSRMRSRSAHREQDRHSWVQQKQSVSGEEEGKDSETPVRETDSQYGTWETGLRTDDSLTPATPSSESTLSPSPRKPTPPETPGDHGSQLDADALDSFPPSSSSEGQPLPFPDTPVTLLDTSALRSRAQLGKKRAPRTRPTRAARQSAEPAAGGTSEDWLYRDSTEAKAESKDDDSDTEDQARGADASPAVASQPQRVALFPGVDASALKAQLKKRGDSDNQIDGPLLPSPSPSQLSRSPKSPFLPRAARVLPPPGSKENGEEDSPQWLKELKSKKRLSQYENES